MAWQLPPFARLRPLGDLDLQLVGVHQVVGGNAEASRSDLLDRASAKIAVLVGEVTYRILAALAGIRFPPDPIHRDRQVLVRLADDRAERHRASLEALDDLGCLLDLLVG